MNANDMIRFFVAISFLVNTLSGAAQEVVVSADSTQMRFPNNVVIEFKKIKKGIAIYQIDRPALKTLLVQCNYLYQILHSSHEKSRLLENEVMIKDSVIRALKTQQKLTDERLSVSQAGYKNLKLVTADYDLQLKHAIGDLERSEKNNRKARRKTLSKGILAGLAAGIGLTAFVFLHSD